MRVATILHLIRLLETPCLDMSVSVINWFHFKSQVYPF